MFEQTQLGMSPILDKGVKVNPRVTKDDQIIQLFNT